VPRPNRSLEIAGRGSTRSSGPSPGPVGRRCPSPDGGRPHRQAGEPRVTGHSPGQLARLWIRADPA
jgi:hypothetical protein